MISITLEHTDSLGPEADVPALLVKLAERLETARLAPGTLVRVGARALTEYVVGEDDWESLTTTIRVPAGDLETFKADLFDDLAALIDAHFTELYARRSIAVSVALDVLGGEALFERRHPRPASAESF
jgi:5-carboxymethyl-2-hydroxymuconate isomerase